MAFKGLKGLLGNKCMLPLPLNNDECLYFIVQYNWPFRQPIGNGRTYARLWKMTMEKYNVTRLQKTPPRNCVWQSNLRRSWCDRLPPQMTNAGHYSSRGKYLSLFCFSFSWGLLWIIIGPFSFSPFIEVLQVSIILLLCPCPSWWGGLGHSRSCALSSSCNLS